MDDLRLHSRFITPAARYGSARPWSAHWQNRTMTQKTHGHMRESKSPYASSLLHRAHLAANPSTPRLRERRDSARLDGPRRLVLQCPRGVTEGPATRRQLSMSQIELRTQTRDSGLRERGESHSSFVTPRARGEPLSSFVTPRASEGRATRVSSLRERARGESHSRFQPLQSALPYAQVIRPRVSNGICPRYCPRYAQVVRPRVSNGAAIGEGRCAGR